MTISNKTGNTENAETEQGVGLQLTALQRTVHSMHPGPDLFSVKDAEMPKSFLVLIPLQI